jgi:AcrR family transcriptional regulator
MDIRTRILDAAVHLLETEGAKSFGQTRVARAAGVKQGNITYHFPKKSDLVAAVIERVNEQRRADLGALIERARALPPDAMRALMFDRLPAMAMDQKRSRVMLALLVEAQDDPDVAKQMESVTTDQRATLAGLLHRVPDDLDLELVLLTISGLSLYALASDRGEHIAALLRRFHEWLPIMLPVAPPTARPAPRRRPAKRAHTGRP